jgi:flavin-dependent dehydrogenase
VLLADLCAGRPPAFKIGETLPAASAAALRDLGIGAGEVAPAGAVACTGTSSAWGAGPPRERSAITDPYGHGWHLDRVGFDALLRARARAAGARVVAGSVSVETTGQGVRRVRVGGKEVACRLVVDATGRRAAIARALGGARRERADRLVAVHAALRSGHDDLDARTRVEATREGWWYSARAGTGRRVVAYLTDADLLDRGLRAPDRFVAACSSTRHVVPEGVRIELAARPATTAAHGARLVPPRGAGWVAVGDAALAFDPLSSQGIHNALATGLMGAAAVCASLRGEGDDGLKRFEDQLASVWAAYESHRAAAYALEDRWPGEPFWTRRRSSGDSATEPAAPRIRRSI